MAVFASQMIRGRDHKHVNTHVIRAYVPLEDQSRAPKVAYHTVPYEYKQQGREHFDLRRLSSNGSLD